MPLYYVDSSALVKLVRVEPETHALEAFLGDADLVSSELVLTEVPRAVRRAAADDPRLDVAILVALSDATIDALALVPLDRALLATAGALSEPRLRTLDAIHVTAAASVTPVDGFVTYDERQGAVARLVGFRTYAP